MEADRTGARAGTASTAGTAEGGRWTVRPARPPMTGLLRERPGRCPAPNVLPPASPEHLAHLASLVRLLDPLTGGRRPATLTDAGVSAADVIAAFAVGVADQLIRRGAFRPAGRPDS
jgi:hypothetical protein